MKIAVLASGGGSNLQSIIDACADRRLAGEVVLVISNNSKAGALERARRHGIAVRHLSSMTHTKPEQVDAAICDELAVRDVDIVALAGYMKKLGPSTLGRYKNRVVNIHPALLPDFGGKGMYGMNVHKAVIAAGALLSGPTVHLVDPEYDEGPILAQRAVPVHQDDTPESLQQRVLAEEHIIYPYTLDAIGSGLIQLPAVEQNLVIRPITLSRNFADAARTVRESFKTPAERFGLTRENCPTHPSFVSEGVLEKIVEKGLFFCMYKDVQAVGCVGVEPSPDDPAVWYIEKLAVLPSHRRQGLGSLLIDHALNAIAVKGGSSASVAIIADDTELTAWYQKRGFAVAGRKHFDHLPFIVAFMAKSLISK